MAADHPPVRQAGLLALDAGTSGARCLIVRPGGEWLAARREWSYQTPADAAPFGRAFDADAFWRILCAVTRQALAEAGLSAGNIAAVGITSQRLGLVAIEADGRPLYAGPNIDARAIAEGLAIDARLGERVYAVTGKLPSVILAPARLQWLRKHREDDLLRAAALLTLGDWVAYCLTGELRAERSLAGDGGLLNVATGERDPDLLAELEVPPRLLPPLASSLEVVGRVTPSAAEASGLAPGLPVVIAGADTQCGLLGMGIAKPGEVGMITGWSCPVQQVTAEPRFDAARRTWVDLHVVPQRWVVESSAADAGHMWRWWCETLLGPGDGALEEGAALAAEAPPGAAEALALLGPAAMNAGAMGLHLGGVLMTTPLAVGSVGRAELLRAALENIAYALRANLEQAEEVSGLRAERVAVGGGFTRAPVFPRLLADVLARPIEVAQRLEVTSLGGAMAAGVAVGLYDDLAAATALASPAERIAPDATAAAAYQRRYERWRCLGPALDETMRRMP